MAPKSLVHILYIFGHMYYKQSVRQPQTNGPGFKRWKSTNSVLASALRVTNSGKKLASDLDPPGPKPANLPTTGRDTRHLPPKRSGRNRKQQRTEVELKRCVSGPQPRHTLSTTSRERETTHSPTRTAAPAPPAAPSRAPSHIRETTRSSYQEHASPHQPTLLEAPSS